MAPITEETVAGLKNIIGKLEARVEDLEGRLSNEPKKSVAEQMRLVLMGPPGAGRW
jgi:adenylate kinase